MKRSVPKNAWHVGSPSRRRPVLQHDSRQVEVSLRNRQAGQYIGEMLLELRNIARSAKLFKVMLPLGYAYYEATAVANRVEVPVEELERLQALAKTGESYKELAEQY